jgi:FkbM family methyltransferase
VSLVQRIARRTSSALGRESWLIRRVRPAYESFLDWSSGGRGIAWEINGVSYRIDPRQRHRLGQNYDAPVAAFLRERVRPGAVCIDVGANVGVYVMQFAHWSRPDGRVIAFEPNPAARTLLDRHVTLNGLRERVTVVPAAVGAQSGTATLYAADADGMSRLAAPNAALAAQAVPLSVPVVTLDDYCEREMLVPDWLFLDVEGFEIAALQGARRLITSRRSALGIVVEMHPDVWDSATTPRHVAEATLAELELRAAPLCGQRDPLGEHGQVYLEHVGAA